MLNNRKLSSSSERQEKAAKVVKYDMTTRGAYLAHVIPIEELVKDIISYHFYSDEDRRKQFIALIELKRLYLCIWNQNLRKAP